MLDKSLVGAKVDSVVEESVDHINKSLNKQIDPELLKESITQEVVNKLEPFITSMTSKFDQCFDIPESVPLLDRATQQNISKETIDTMKGHYEELVKTYMRVFNAVIVFFITDLMRNSKILKYLFRINTCWMRQRLRWNSIKKLQGLSRKKS